MCSSQTVESGNESISVKESEFDCPLCFRMLYEPVTTPACGICSVSLCLNSFRLYFHASLRRSHVLSALLASCSSNAQILSPVSRALQLRRSFAAHECVYCALARNGETASLQGMFLFLLWFSWVLLLFCSLFFVYSLSLLLQERKKETHVEKRQQKPRFGLFVWYVFVCAFVISFDCLFSVVCLCSHHGNASPLMVYLFLSLYRCVCCVLCVYRDVPHFPGATIRLWMFEPKYACVCFVVCCYVFLIRFSVFSFYLLFI